MASFAWENSKQYMMLDQSNYSPRSTPDNTDPGPRYKVKAVRRDAEVFSRLLADWRRQTARIPSPEDIVSHPTSIALMQCNRAEELIVKSLEEDPSLLVFLMRDLTGENPYKGVAAGDITAMARCWVDWYHRKSVVAA